MSAWPVPETDRLAPPGHPEMTRGGNAMFVSELMMCIVVVGVAAYLAVDEYADRLRAARLVEPMINAGILRNLWVEDFALAGTAPADSAAYDRDPEGRGQARTAAGSDALGTVSGLEALRARAVQTDDAVEPSAAAGEGSRLRDAVVGISDGVPMAVMHRSDFARPVIIELRPALQAPDAPVVRWLCDDGPPPPGWSAPSPRGPRPPNETLPSVCRKGWKP